MSSPDVHLDLADPTAVSPTSPWAEWTRFLAYRYHPDSSKRASGPQKLGAPVRRTNAWVDFVEFVNEPNYECWPQKPAGRGLQSAKLTAAMIRTVVEIESVVNASSSVPMRFTGPGAASVLKNKANARSCPYDIFLLAIANGLQRRVSASGSVSYQEFDAGRNFAFSHHNYEDVGARRTRSPRAAIFGPSGRAGRETNSAQWVVRLLRSGIGTKRGSGWWRGWPDGGAATAGLLLTEGGAKRKSESSNAPTLTEVRQRLEDQYNHLRTTPAGKGVALFTQFLAWEDIVGVTDPRTDSHLTSQYFRPRRDSPNSSKRLITSLGREPYAEEIAKCRNDYGTSPVPESLYTVWKRLQDS